MHGPILRAFAGASALLLASFAQAQFDGYVNHGLVGVGRLPARLFDKAGNGKQDTLGGFSAMAVDPKSLTYQGRSVSGILYGLPDRGFGDGSTDYHPRLEVFRFSISPYRGSGPTGQDQISFVNMETRLLTYDNGIPFTGLDAAGTNHHETPLSATNSIAKGRRSLDPEGLALMADGSFWISDEYGPGLNWFTTANELRETLNPCAALTPRIGAYPGAVNYSAVKPPDSGRRNNRGLEGLSVTPDGRRLAAFLQSPLMQDGGGSDVSRNTRILHMEIDSRTGAFGRLVAEHVYQLALPMVGGTNRQTVVSEGLALNDDTFLVLERDSLGRGALTNLAPVYKRVVLCSTRDATNLAGTGYDREKGAPGQESLPAGDLPPDIKPATRRDFVDLLATDQLAKFSLNTKATPDENTLSEKWEALALIPLKDPARPDDYLLLVGNDNDFKAPVTWHNGKPVSTNSVSVDHMLLAYQITLPGVAKMAR